MKRVRAAILAAIAAGTLALIGVAPIIGWNPPSIPGI